MTNTFRLSMILCFLYTFSIYSQFSVVLKYKKARCGGVRTPDTTSYFILANKKWIIQYPSQKIDTIYTDVNGKIKIPNKKGAYYLYEPWKFYHQCPNFTIQLYDKSCLNKAWQTPDFTITVISNKKYKLSPLYLNTHCPDKHPCLRTDTIIPHIPRQ